MSTTVQVKLHFAAGHRILGLTGLGAKCVNIHGHTWQATWTFTQDQTWPPVVEFGYIKAELRAFIISQLDHTFFVDVKDPFLDYLRDHDLRYTITEGPPTTERIAEALAAVAHVLFPEAKLTSVLLEEGPENSARWHA